MLIRSIKDLAKCILGMEAELRAKIATFKSAATSITISNSLQENTALVMQIGNKASTIYLPYHYDLCEQFGLSSAEEAKAKLAELATTDKQTPDFRVAIKMNAKILVHGYLADHPDIVFDYSRILSDYLKSYCVKNAISCMANTKLDMRLLSIIQAVRPVENYKIRTAQIHISRNANVKQLIMDFNPEFLTVMAIEDCIAEIITGRLQVGQTFIENFCIKTFLFLFLHEAKHAFRGDLSKRKNDLDKAYQNTLADGAINSVLSQNLQMSTPDGGVTNQALPITFVIKKLEVFRNILDELLKAITLNISDADRRGLYSTVEEMANSFGMSLDHVFEEDTLVNFFIYGYSNKLFDALNLFFKNCQGLAYSKETAKEEEKKAKSKMTKLAVLMGMPIKFKDLDLVHFSGQNSFHCVLYAGEDIVVYEQDVINKKKGLPTSGKFSNQNPAKQDFVGCCAMIEFPPATAIGAQQLAQMLNTNYALIQKMVKSQRDLGKTEQEIFDYLYTNVSTTMGYNKFSVSDIQKIASFGDLLAMGNPPKPPVPTPPAPAPTVADDDDDDDTNIPPIPEYPTFTSGSLVAVDGKMHIVLNAGTPDADGVQNMQLYPLKSLSKAMLKKVEEYLKETYDLNLKDYL